MPDEGKYLYCIIGETQERNFGPIGIGGRGDTVQTLCYRDLACVMSSTPMTRYVISREHLTAHEQVIETVMKEYTVLPIRFCTIAASAEEVRGLLARRSQEFKNLLRSMDNKVELGVKAFWRDLEGIFREVGESYADVKRLRERLAEGPNPPSVDERVGLGKQVHEALEKKRSVEAEEILDCLRPICIDLRANKTVGEEMVLNGAFLVDRSREIEFDDRIHEASERSKERLRFTYVGPVPPFNFVELRIAWGQETS